jgi:putative Mg2+ transporter-C (MgtC) family protein
MELELVLQVIIATLLGGLIGLEREFHGRDAGLRTYAAVALGACTFGIISANVINAPDPTRIAAQVVTGVGFLGAGVILRGKNRVHGLTTAATLWVSAAVGLGVAYEMYLLAATTAVLNLLLLLLHHAPYWSQHQTDEKASSFISATEESLS